MPDPKGYQVCLFLGQQAPTIEGSVVIPVSPVSDSQDDVIAAIRDSGLTPADTRARTLVLVDVKEAPMAAMLYSALVGFCGRRLDFAVKDEIVDASALHEAAHALQDAGKPEEPEELVQTGRPDPEITSVASGSALSPQDVGHIRYSRKARIAHEGDVRTLLVELVAVAAMRMKGTADRLPFLLDEDGTEYDLDSVRRAGGDLRRAIRTDDRNAVVESVPLTSRQLRWVEAAMQPISSVLERLGSHQDPETELWRCPRPDRHTNGDANPSLKVVDNSVRCYRCDPESVDALRLVMDVGAMTPDEAASWILEPAP